MPAPSKNLLREWRTSRGWTLVDVEGLTGIGLSYLSRIERGQREPPPRTKVQIARGLGVDVADLFPRRETADV